MTACQLEPGPPAQAGAGLSSIEPILGRCRVRKVSGWPQRCPRTCKRSKSLRQACACIGPSSMRICTCRRWSKAGQHRDHELGGGWAGYRDCHIKPELLLIYGKPDADPLRLARMGSHGLAQRFSADRRPRCKMSEHVDQQVVERAVCSRIGSGSKQPSTATSSTGEP